MAGLRSLLPTEMQDLPNGRYDFIGVYSMLALCAEAHGSAMQTYALIDRLIDLDRVMLVFNRDDQPIASVSWTQRSAQGPVVQITAPFGHDAEIIKAARGHFASQPQAFTYCPRAQPELQRLW